MAQHSRQMTQKSARVGAMLGQCWLLGAHVGVILSLCWAKNGVFIIWALALGLRWTRHFSVMWGPENSGAATWWRFGRARWRYVMRFRRVPGQIPCEICEVPEGSGAETLWGSGWFRRRRCLVRFRRVPVHIPCEVPEGSGTDASWKAKVVLMIFWHEHHKPLLFIFTFLPLGQYRDFILGLLVSDQLDSIPNSLLKTPGSRLRSVSKGCLWLCIYFRWQVVNVQVRDLNHPREY